MDDSRTMIAGVFSPDKTKNHVVFSDGTTKPLIEAKDLIVDPGLAPGMISYNGEAYAKLPEGWPAAEAKDLEEAHAEAVASDEGMSEFERELYTWTPEEVQALASAYIAAEQENMALRKGMKTMQRKTRKQNQVQRRLERRLAQARAGREQLRDQAEQYKGIAAINQGAALELSLQQLERGERVEL